MHRHLLRLETTTIRSLCANRSGAHYSIGAALTRSFSSTMTSKLRFNGTYTALVTPFTPDGSAVDYDSLKKMVEWQIQEGIDGLVPMGSTGENTLVSDEERLQVIKTVIKTVNGRVPVIAGTGSLSTDGAVQLAREAKELGADACLVIAPPYVCASQRGLYEHFRRVASVGLPVMIYDNPGRAGVSLEPQTIAELAKVPGIAALKDATDSVTHAVDVMALCDLPVVCGADNLALPMMACGAVGVMSILSNVVPSRVLAITKAMEKGDIAAARKAHQANVLLVNSLFVEPNPIPTKKAMELLGRCSSTVRSPLTECTTETEKLLLEQLKANKLL
ncbi:dihydrodipicolinate synthase, variant 1 [Phytophthora nicotianae INRA-310]|uniref:4-hydroxy-tetrahydrodipicolinate synthase n=7 Tax=Phytophthora nicotianae TaxID=4792 RepID=V9E7E7_PHYNI|nr:dihydrodipicolinate synthase [Phytophthora nicotianae INRA-310]XP_008913407.1 dihydrodipicolinate synthase, variant 1 [Phytophthora nicotianae INRA-310]ETI34896.1 dihydrodipicolinate synthase [Phytophthora nicotianae P1569]ETM35057.1 dihydrodipicolinate synthase [Phytophthora nicotianae]ETI34897.1 dihydrodipicolinate synthase, variant 1 [Phytophthora nicotianae P1569]ETM35058.1 dihydrodipicolinate synthase, variant 1 [Phytophthora nicotianae]ETN01305.1 dihydrodipicolinate synthase [Phytoph